MSNLARSLTDRGFTTSDLAPLTLHAPSPSGIRVLIPDDGTVHIFDNDLRLLARLNNQSDETVLVLVDHLLEEIPRQENTA